MQAWRAGTQIVPRSGHGRASHVGGQAHIAGALAGSPAARWRDMPLLATGTRQLEAVLPGCRG
jgi:hypothetical protein